MKNIIDWLFKTKDDEIVITQSPNWQIMSALILWALSLLVESQPYNNLLVMLYRLALLYWASLEIRLGANRFRGILGTIVFAVALLGILEQLL